VFSNKCLFSLKNIIDRYDCTMVQTPSKPGQNRKVYFDFYETLYIKIFEVADYESGIKVVKFQMADTIWRTQITKKRTMNLKLNIEKFSRSLTTDL